MLSTGIWDNDGNLIPLTNIKHMGNNIKDVAVVIVNRDRPDLTDQLVENINKNKGDLLIDLYVIEMGSSQLSKHATFRYDDTDFRGKAYGHNVGVRYVKARGKYRYYFTVMNDVYFTSVNGLEELVVVADRYTDVGIISPTEPESGYAGGICKPIKGREYHCVSQVNYLALLIRSECIDSIGYLTPEFKYCWGAIHELSYKMYLNGYKVAYCDVVTMKHLGSSTYGKVASTVSREEYLQKAQRFAAQYMIEHYGLDWDKKFTKALSDDVVFNTYSKHKNKWEKQLIVGGNNMKKLHLGCGTKKREGWINVDIDEKLNPDIVADVKDLRVFETNTIDIIECCHLLEHLTNADALTALMEWYRVLKLGGKLLIELPNLQRCVELLYEKESKESEMYAMIGIFGGSYLPDETRIDSIHQMHKSGWSLERLSEELKKIGFKKITNLPVTQTWRKATKFNRDMRLECIK